MKIWLLSGEHLLSDRRAFLKRCQAQQGGVRYIPIMGEDEAENFIAAMSKRLSETDRLLPGGYVYLSDLLGTPSVLRQIGRLIATQYREGPC